MIVIKQGQTRVKVNAFQNSCKGHDVELFKLGALNISELRNCEAHRIKVKLFLMQECFVMRTAAQAVGLETMAALFDELYASLKATTQKMEEQTRMEVPRRSA